MFGFVSILSEKSNLKKLLKCEKNIFILYPPRKKTIKTADTELLIKLPENTTACLITKFEGQEIQKIIGPAKKRLWITLLNESYFESYIIEKGSVLGYLVIELEDIKLYYATKKKKNSRSKTKPPNTYLPKDWKKSWKKYFEKKKVSSSHRRIFK